MSLNLLKVCLFTSLLQLSSTVVSRSYKEPTCNPPCLNGFCSRDNVCVCNAQYTNDKSKPYRCIPRCNATESFENGQCLKKCNFRCYGERCTPPVYCYCDQGWKIGRQGVCFPTCDPGCGNGKCTDWNFCRCDIGYTYVRNANPFCQPKCENCKDQHVAPNDGNNSSCIGDCKTKSNKVIPIPDASTTPRPVSVTTQTKEIKVEQKLNVAYQILPRTKSIKGGQEPLVNQTESSFRVNFLFGVSVCVATVIILVSLIFIILIIREIRK